MQCVEYIVYFYSYCVVWVCNVCKEIMWCVCVGLISTLWYCGMWTLLRTLRMVCVVRVIWQCIDHLYTTLPYTTPHYTTLHYTTLHYTTPPPAYTLHYTTLHHTTPHYATLHHTTLHHTTLHHTIHYTHITIFTGHAGTDAEGRHGAETGEPAENTLFSAQDIEAAVSLECGRQVSTVLCVVCVVSV